MYVYIYLYIYIYSCMKNFLPGTDSCSRLFDSTFARDRPVTCDIVNLSLSHHVGKSLNQHNYENRTLMAMRNPPLTMAASNRHIDIYILRRSFVSLFFITSAHRKLLRNGPCLLVRHMTSDVNNSSVPLFSKFCSINVRKLSANICREYILSKLTIYVIFTTA